MIISHSGRFIFFAVPRTGTHAIREALQPMLQPGDWQQQNLYAKMRLPIPALAAKGHGHLSADEVRRHLPADVWRSYFKFALVRNPFDRFVSACFFLHRQQPEFARSPIPHMKRALSFERFRQRVLIRPQLALLRGADGSPALDYIGRFEDLQGAYDEICRHIRAPAATLEKRNASSRAGYTAYYDPELRERVARLYRDDLRTFGYAFEDEEPAVPSN